MLLIRIGVRDEHIRVIDVSKHAVKQDEDDNQYQLICAGVSAIAVGLCNAIEEICPEQSSIDVVSDEDDSSALNHITIVVVEDSLDLQTVLKVGKYQLETVANSYENYIDYKITEV